MNTNKKFLLNVAIISLSLGVISLSSCTVLETVETIKKIKHNYSDEELKAIYASSIRALNEVNYPLKDRKVNISALSSETGIERTLLHKFIKCSSQIRS